jgi:Uma2 family endonuclease
MGPEEQARVVESLPGEVTDEEMAMPEGDRHFWPKVRTLDAIEGYFGDQRRKVYLAAELPVYYPGERRFAPDLLVVLDVEKHKRDKWVVSYEGKGLDWVLEVHVGGDRKKDAVYNVERYARLGIPEYFIFDGARQRLEGYWLPTPEAREYERMEPRHGRYVSQVLGLELEAVGEELRLWAGDALVLGSGERLAQARQALEEVRKRAEEEARRREEEARRREELERRLAELQAEMERLQHRGA